MSLSYVPRGQRTDLGSLCVFSLSSWSHNFPEQAIKRLPNKVPFVPW